MRRSAQRDSTLRSSTTAMHVMSTSFCAEPCLNRLLLRLKYRLHLSHDILLLSASLHGTVDSDLQFMRCAFFVFESLPQIRVFLFAVLSKVHASWFQDKAGSLPSMPPSTCTQRLRMSSSDVWSLAEASRRLLPSPSPLPLRKHASQPFRRSSRAPFPHERIPEGPRFWQTIVSSVLTCLTAHLSFAIALPFFGH